MFVYDTNPDLALTIIDSAELLGNIEKEHATLMRAMVYIRSTSLHHPDTACQMLEGLMETDFIKDNPSYHITALDLLIHNTRVRRDFEKCLHWSIEKSELCREMGDETEALRTEAEIGWILANVGEEEKGLAKINGVIANLDGQRHFNEMDACIIALKRKINLLNTIGSHAEVIPIARLIINKISDYREHPSDYNDDSDRLPPTDAERTKYCNFYTAQAYGNTALAYADLGKRDSARYYLSLFENYYLDQMNTLHKSILD